MFTLAADSHFSSASGDTPLKLLRASINAWMRWGVVEEVVVGKIGVEENKVEEKKIYVEVQRTE